MSSKPSATSTTPAMTRNLPNWKGRSEEHTSELQSHLNLVCRLLLEKKKKNTDLPAHHITVSGAVHRSQNDPTEPIRAARPRHTRHATRALESCTADRLGFLLVSASS